MNQIKPKEGTTNIIFKVCCSDDFQPISLAYKEFDKKELQEYLSLKESFEKLKETHSSISHIAVNDCLNWFDDVPEELEEINEYVENNERCCVDSLPVEFLSLHESRTEYDECFIDHYGIKWKTYLKHTSVEAHIWEMPWREVEQLLKNCDPQSVRFIKDEE